MRRNKFQNKFKLLELISRDDVLSSGEFKEKNERGLATSRLSCLKKNLNASRPSEHPPVRREKMSKCLGGIMCVCVCFLPIHSGHQVRWTYQPGSHRRKVTQDF